MFDKPIIDDDGGGSDNVGIYFIYVARRDF